VLWVVPVSGGPARRLTDDLQDVAMPAWSPDGRSIVVQSYRDGHFHLWTVPADGGPARRLTSGPQFDYEPRYAPDGRSIAFASDRGGASNIFLLSTADNSVRRLTSGTERLGMPAWSPDGRRIACTVDEAAVDVIDVASGQRTRAVTAGEGQNIYGPCFAGDELVYTLYDGVRSDLVAGGRTLTSGEDVFGFAPGVLADGSLLYTADGHLRRRGSDGTTRDIPFTAELTVPGPGPSRPSPFSPDAVGRTRATRGIVAPALSPNGKQIAYGMLGALWLTTLGEQPRKVVDDGYWNSDPEWAPDG
jgi:Tol biopolymer transport system component